MPAAVLTVPIAILIVYLVFRPDPKFKLPKFEEEMGLWSPMEKKDADYYRPELYPVVDKGVPWYALLCNRNAGCCRPYIKRCLKMGRYSREP